MKAQGRTRSERMASWESEYSLEGRIWRGPGEIDPQLPLAGIVLELGCGNGKTLSALANHAGLVVGLDFSRNALEACKKVRRDLSRVELVQGDVTSLPFGNGTVDSMIAYHVLDHLYEEERCACAKEMGRVLGPGGHLAVKVFARTDMRFGKGEEVEPNTFLRRQGIELHYFGEEELLQLLSSLKVRHIETQSRTKRFDGQDRQRSEILAMFDK